MCNIGRRVKMVDDEPAPMTVIEVFTRIPIKVREFVYAKRLQRMEGKKDSRTIDPGVPKSHE